MFLGLRIISNLVAVRPVAPGQCPKLYVLNRSEERVESVEHRYDQDNTQAELDWRHWSVKKLTRPLNGAWDLL